MARQADKKRFEENVKRVRVLTIVQWSVIGFHVALWLLLRRFRETSSIVTTILFLIIYKWSSGVLISTAKPQYDANGAMTSPGRMYSRRDLPGPFGIST